MDKPTELPTAASNESAGGGYHPTYINDMNQTSTGQQMNGVPMQPPLQSTRNFALPNPQNGQNGVPPLNNSEHVQSFPPDPQQSILGYAPFPYNISNVPSQPSRGKCVLKPHQTTVTTVVNGTPVTMKRTVHVALFDNPIAICRFHTLFAKANCEVRGDARHFTLNEGRFCQILGLNTTRFDLDKIMNNDFELRATKNGEPYQSAAAGHNESKPTVVSDAGKKRSRAAASSPNASAGSKRCFKDDITIVNLTTKTRSNEYFVCSLCKDFSCGCYKRIHGVSSETINALELCPRYLPGRTYYAYGFGRYPLRPMLDAGTSEYNKLCLVVSLDGHIMFIDNDLLAAIEFFDDMSPDKLSQFGNSKYICGISNVERYGTIPEGNVMHFGSMKQFFRPVPAPPLSSEFIKWYGNCTLELSGDEPLLHTRPMTPGKNVVIMRAKR